MIIESLKVSLGMEEKEFLFSHGNTIIHSLENSRGKTTLLRLLLYSLGYNIPGTRKFKFGSCTVSCAVITDSGEMLSLVRSSADFIVLSSGHSQRTFCLPDQILDLHTIVFGTSNEYVINNLLGVFYLDQEKGWTLLNRGTVIGSIHFNVEDLILGLSGRDCKELKEIEEKLIREQVRFQQIANVVKYKESIAESAGMLLTEEYEDELGSDIAYKEIELSAIKKELHRIDEVLKCNQYLKKFVEQMSLMIMTPNGDTIPVTSENIIGLNDSLDYLIAKRRIKAAEYKEVSKSLEMLIQQRESREEPKLFSVESIADLFDKMVHQFPCGYEQIETILRDIKNQLAQVRCQISDAIRVNNDVVSSLYNSIIKYASEFDLGDSSSIAKNYLFTSNLKELSGAVLHKTVFVFKLAYLLEIKKRFGIVLPIILDSPSGKELDVANKEKIVSILNRDFADHQIIIASIFDYDLNSPTMIELSNFLME